jgi:hypothetical protein
MAASQTRNGTISGAGGCSPPAMRAANIPAYVTAHAICIGEAGEVKHANSPRRQATFRVLRTW